MSKTLIYLSRISLTDAVYEQMRLSFFIKHSLQVMIFDLSLLDPAYKQEQCTVKYKVEKISSYFELEEKIKLTVSESIYVDNIYGINGIQYDNFRHVFKLLHKYNARYWVIETGPVPAYKIKKNHYIKTLPNLLLMIKRLRIKILTKIIICLAKYKILYQLPEKIFYCCTYNMESYIKKYNLGVNITLPIHSLDYDRYLSYQLDNQTIQNSDHKFCVFLDDGFIYHPDIISKKNKYSNVFDYNNSICCFFDFIESNLKLKVIIAANPRSDYSASIPLFGGREIIYGKSIDLVAKSSLVLAHYSTSISYAILFDKPLLLLMTKYIPSDKSEYILQSFGVSLGVDVVDIDKNYIDFSSLILDYHNWKNNYESYKNKYIIAPNATNNFIWEILAKEF